VSPHKGDESSLAATHKGGALYRRASPLERIEISRSSERDEGRCPSILQAFEKA